MDVFRPFNHDRTSSEQYEESPDAASSADGAHADTRLARSCNVCHKRKVKCDRALPCSNCSRAGIECVYPDTIRPPRKTHRTSVVQLNDRIAKLEGLIIDLSTKKARPTPVPITNVPVAFSKPEPKPEQRDDVTEGFLLPTNGSAAFVDDAIYANLLNEVKSIRIEAENLDTPAAADSRSDFSAPTIPSALFTSISPAAREELALSYPSGWEALQLWNAFKYSIDPVLKILHVPSAEKMIMDAIGTGRIVNADMSAFLYTVYYAGAVSMSHAQVQRELNQDRGVLLRRYRRCAELALSGSNLIDAPNMMCLQAFVIFLQARRTNSNSTALWILAGLANRTGQALGLHKRGRRFNISPFETQLRRRLWWQIVLLDLRSSEDYGAGRYDVDPSWDAPFPANVNDVDLYPGMTAEPVERQTWTDTSFALMRLVIARAYSELHNLQRATNASNAVAMLEPKRQLLEKLRADLDSYLVLGYGQQETTLLQKISKAKTDGVVTKMEHFVQDQFRRLVGDRTGVAPSAPPNLASMREILYIGDAYDNESDNRRFFWMQKTYVQWHVMAQIYRSVATDPKQPDALDLFNMANEHFNSIGDEDMPYEGGPVYNVIRALRQYAKKQLDILHIGPVPTSPPEPVLPPLTAPPVAQEDIVFGMADMNGGFGQAGQDFDYANLLSWDTAGIPQFGFTNSSLPGWPEQESLF